MLHAEGIRIFFLFGLLNILTFHILPIIMSSVLVSMHSCCTSTKFLQEEENKGIGSLYTDPLEQVLGVTKPCQDQGFDTALTGILHSLLQTFLQQEKRLHKI